MTGKHYNDTISLPANEFTAPFGFVFNRWYCDNSIGYKDVDSTFSMPMANVQCTAQWVPSIVNLIWEENGGTMPDNYTNPSSCTYGTLGGISTIYQPSKIGYDFKGWLVTGWDECGLRSLDVTLTSSVAYGKINANSCVSVIGSSSNSSDCTDSVYDDLDNKEWKDVFAYGTVYGRSYCGTNNGSVGHAGDPGTEGGTYCWCAVTRFVPSAGTGNSCTVTSPSYVLFQSSNNNCSSECTGVCANQTGWQYTNLRSGLYGQSQ